MSTSESSGQSREPPDSFSWTPIEIQPEHRFRRHRGGNERGDFVLLDQRALYAAANGENFGPLSLIRARYAAFSRTGDLDCELTEQDHDEAVAFEDRLLEMLEIAKAKVFTAAWHNTPKFREIFLITEEPSRVSKICKSIPCGGSGRMMIQIEPDLSYLRSEILPNGREFREALDHRVVDANKEYGDDGKVPREIIHFVYGEAGLVENFMQRVRRIHGLDVEYDGEWCRITEIAPCTIEVISERTYELDMMARSFDVTYDGWETEVVKNKRPDSIQ